MLQAGGASAIAQVVVVPIPLPLLHCRQHGPRESVLRRQDGHVEGETPEEAAVRELAEQQAQQQGTPPPPRPRPRRENPPGQSAPPNHTRPSCTRRLPSPGEQTIQNVRAGRPATEGLPDHTPPATPSVVGMSHRAVAARFKVSAASVSRGRALERRSGNLRPGPLGGDRRSGVIEAQPTALEPGQTDWAEAAAQAEGGLGNPHAPSDRGPTPRPRHIQPGNRQQAPRV